MNRLITSLKSGFTLIELLIGISIIGILASIILSSLISARQRAVSSSALQTARSALPIVLDCLLYGYTVNLLNEVSGGGFICSSGYGSTVPWPKLPTGWTWISGFPPSSPAGSIFVLQSFDSSGVYYIGCSYLGCVQTGPNPLMPP